MNFDKYDTIIWDWNGTLLNDVCMCIRCMNQLLKPRNIPLLDKEIYQEVFTFPVQDYYERIGIDFEKDPFNVIGHDFMDLYFEALPTCELHEGVEEVLKYFKAQNKRQFILSAMEHDSLMEALKVYRITDYFEATYGIDNHLAASKIGRAHQMIKDFDISITSSLMFGDTLHDKDVAAEMGVDINLISIGHQSESVLQMARVPVLPSLSAIISK